MLRPLELDDPPLVGRYELLGRLGSGGMGTVFLGRSPGGRLVAVKLIRPELVSDPAFRARFAHEVSAVRNVSGFFTAPVVDADPDGQQPWLVTAYVPGPSLAEAVADHGPLPVSSVQALAAGLAEGLGAIHAAGLVHRDLKPSNVLLGSDGPRIIDFGISRAVDGTAATRSGTVVGSPVFMSPEQAEGGEIGPPSDVFSLGGVLTFAATGEGPFGAGEAAALLYRVVHAEPATGKLPAGLRPLVGRCLIKDPAGRPATDQILAQTGRPHVAAGWLPESISHTLQRYAQPVVASAGRAEATAAASSRDPAGRSGPAPADAVADAPEEVAGPPEDDGGADPASQATVQRTLAQARPNGRGRSPRWAWAGGVAVAVLVIGAVVLAMTARTPSAPAEGSSSARSSAPSSPQPSASAAAPAVSPARSPRAVLEAYIAAVNAHDWRKAWRLGAKNLGIPYSAVAAGYRNTARDVIASTRVSGDTVVARILTYEANGVVKTYQVRCTVRDGKITASSQTLLATTYPSEASGCPSIRYSADGTAGPLFCANGQPNPPVLAYYQNMRLLVMTLGQDATPGQVLRAMCTDLSHSSFPIETAAYALAQRINGWSFDADPAQEMRLGACGD